MDYGAHLKATMPNPSRRSRHYARQSPFEGSRRQKRSSLLRAAMEGVRSPEELAEATGIELAEADEILDELAAEGFLVREGGRVEIA
jgi:A/G-specific adenine glycosylase